MRAKIDKVQSAKERRQSRLQDRKRKKDNDTDAIVIDTDAIATATTATKVCYFFIIQANIRETILL